MSEVKRKTHLSAVVAIPPRELWEPIQEIRQRHDRHVRDWMPHVTLLYPFRPADEFDAAAAALAGLGVAPFEARLAAVRFFRHTPASHTIWIDPEPHDPWTRLQAALMAKFPDCDDVTKYDNGFTPHLSVGQSHTGTLAGEIQSLWREATWRVSEVALIAREDRMPFEVRKVVPL